MGWILLKIPLLQSNVFELAPSSVVSWEQRLKWHVVKWQGEKRKITVVEM